MLSNVEIFCKGFLSYKIDFDTSQPNNNKRDKADSELMMLFKVVFKELQKLVLYS
jgi:hypothetical protein